MTTDIVRHESPHNWIEALAPAHELATAVARAGEFVPAALRNRPEAVMACIMVGDALGIHPMIALQKIHIIEGRAGLAAELQRSLVISAGHKIWDEEITNTRVVMCGQRKDEDHVTKVQWTLDDAKKAGLAGKQVWQRYPRDMLIARASSQLCRLRFADCLAGMSYSKEELEDGFGVDDGAEVVEPDTAAIDPAPEAAAPATRQRAPRKAAARTTKKAAASAPRAAAPGPSSAPQPPLPGEDEEPPTGEITTSMRDDNYIAMKARGVGIDHHVIVRAVTNGRVQSAKEIDEDEKAQVLAAITDVHEGRRVLTLSEEDVPQLIDRDPDADKPIDDQQRADLEGEVARLSVPEKAALAARVKGVVPNFRSDRFTVRHLFLVLDRLPEPAESPEDGAAEPETEADAGLPFDD